VGVAAETGVGSTPVDELVGCWWVLHTKARNEKALAGDLARLHVQHFLPVIECRRVYAGRARYVKIPLFPGYLFLCGRAEDRLAALRTHRVAKVLEVADQIRLRTDLRQIQRVVEGTVPVDLYPRLRRGCRCRVTSGPLAGLEGVVLRRRGRWRVYVGVEFLGQSAELDIDPMFLDVID
jgi:transcription antitermination factor NusG